MEGEEPPRASLVPSPHTRRTSDALSSIELDIEADTPVGESTMLRSIPELRAERDRLAAEAREQTEARELEREIEALRRVRDAGATPRLHVPVARSHSTLTTRTSTQGDEEDSSYEEEERMRPDPDKKRKRPRPRDPKEYSGQSLKAANQFISQLQTCFFLDPEGFRDDATKVVYASSFLSGDASATWHANYGANKGKTMLFSEFEAFVRDRVADPVNRSFDVGAEYERAKQKDNETVARFAESLTVLENQFDEPYTPTQRMRHLLHKLRPDIAKQITLRGDMPPSVEALVSLAERIENALGGDRSARVQQHLSQGHRLPQKKRRTEEPEQHTRRDRDDRRAPSGPSLVRRPAESKAIPIQCYECGELGHKRPDCPRTRRAPATSMTRRTNVSLRPTEGKVRSLKSTRLQA